MLVDDPKDYEELHEMVLDQELCIHITEDMLTMSPDPTNGYSGNFCSEDSRRVKPNRVRTEHEADRHKEALRVTRTGTR